MKSSSEELQKFLLKRFKTNDKARSKRIENGKVYALVQNYEDKARPVQTLLKNLIFTTTE